MKFIEYAEKLETIKYMIEHKRAGTPFALAKKLNLSERTIQRMIMHLRENGYPVKFNRVRGCYEVDFSEKN